MINQAILYSLYNSIDPKEKRPINTAKTQKLQAKLSKSETYFKSLLSEEDWLRFENWKGLFSERDIFKNYEIFVHGYLIGAGITLESSSYMPKLLHSDILTDIEVKKMKKEYSVNNSILFALYNGEIDFEPRIDVDTLESKKVKQKIEDVETYFKSILSAEVWNQFVDFEETIYVLFNQNEYEFFKNGFDLGMGLMLETIAGINEFAKNK